MKNLKLYLILIILALVLSYSALGIVFARYQHTTRMNLNINITPRPQYEMTGSNHQVQFEKNTKSEITVSMIPGESIWERIYIPLETLSVGLYQLSFDVVMETTSPYQLIIDNTKYVYGCTVGTNEMLEIGDYRFIWKSITPLEKEHVDLAFWATEADVAAKKVTWVWNWGNIRDNYRSRLFLTNIKVERISSPSSGVAYFDFPNSQHVYLDYNDNGELKDKYGGVDAEDVIGENAYHPAKGTFVRQATYNDFTTSIETLGKYENLNIPIKNLTVGKSYKVKFDMKRTEIDFWTTTGVFGCFIKDSKCIPSDGEVLKYFVCKFNSSQLDVDNNSLTFTATATTMYWVWQFGTLRDGRWFHMWLNNCTITQV